MLGDAWDSQDSKGCLGFSRFLGMLEIPQMLEDARNIQGCLGMLGILKILRDA